MASVALTGVQVSVQTGTFFIVWPWTEATYTVGFPWIAVVPFGSGRVNVT
jgi:hypothetical protein